MRIIATPTGSQAAFRPPLLDGQAVWPARRRVAPPFALRDQADRLVSLSAERGHTVLIAFLGLGCGPVCALEAGGLVSAEQQVAPSQRAVLLIVSLDPRATRAQLDEVARRVGLSGDWHWLLGSRAELAAVWRSYGIDPGFAPGSSSTRAVYLIDARGFERVGVHAPFLPQFLADDLRTLARVRA